VIDLPHAFLTVARSIVDKTFKPEPITLGTGSRVVMLVMNDALRDRVPAAIRARVDSLQAEMLAGRFTAPKSER
jgi:basic membrane lipoprotein Med (substrate-binding protein (PBP1-ABC) superfamily)